MVLDLVSSAKKGRGRDIKGLAYLGAHFVAGEMGAPKRRLIRGHAVTVRGQRPASRPTNLQQKRSSCLCLSRYHSWFSHLVCVIRAGKEKGAKKRKKKKKKEVKVLFPLIFLN